MRHTGWTTDTCCYIYRHMVVLKQDTIILLSLTKSRCEETTRHKMTRKYVTARWLPRIPWRNIQIEPWQLMNTVLKIKKMKVQTRNKNNLFRKLSRTQRGARPHTMRTTGLVLCLYAGEYAYPMCSRSNHVKRVNVKPNVASKTITECFIIIRKVTLIPLV